MKASDANLGLQKAFEAKDSPLKPDDIVKGLGKSVEDDLMVAVPIRQQSSPGTYCPNSFLEERTKRAANEDISPESIRLRPTSSEPNVSEEGGKSGDLTAQGNFFVFYAYFEVNGLMPKHG